MMKMKSLEKHLDDAIILENDLSPDEYNQNFRFMADKVNRIWHEMYNSGPGLTRVQNMEFNINRIVFDTIKTLTNIIDYVDWVRFKYHEMFCIWSNPITNTMSMNAIDELGADYKNEMWQIFINNIATYKSEIIDLMAELNFERIFDYDEDYEEDYDDDYNYHYGVVANFRDYGNFGEYEDEEVH